jgi:hypothetical protein
MRVERAIFASGCAHSSCVCELLRDSQGRVSSLRLLPLSLLRARSSTARSIYYNLTKNTYTHSRMQRQRREERVCATRSKFERVCVSYFLCALRRRYSLSMAEPEERMMRTHSRKRLAHLHERTHTAGIAAATQQRLEN